MSFIHDALKKSEAERRRGEVPRLQSEPFSPPPRRRPLWPFLLTLALLINGAVLGWWLLFREEPPAMVAMVAGGPSQSAADARAATPEPVRLPAAVPAKRAAVPVATAPADDPVAVAVDPPRPAEPALPLEPEVTTVVVEEKTVATATSHAGSAPRKTADQGVTTRRMEPSAAARSKAAAVPVAESYPPVSDLPGDVRSGLPALDMQLHFFTPAADRRLVRLNGANLREGDKSGDGLTVVAITSEGVKLSWGGVRFFLPTGRP
jgi:general secretion pathway protein B